MCKALGLDTHHLDEDFTRTMSALRLLHYSDYQSKPTEGVFGCGAHTDYGMFTFLMTVGSSSSNSGGGGGGRRRRSRLMCGDKEDSWWWWWWWR